jgi:hypothetical protein
MMDAGDTQQSSLTDGHKADMNGNNCDPLFEEFLALLVSFCQIPADHPDAAAVFHWAICDFPTFAIDHSPRFVQPDRPPRESTLAKLLVRTSKALQADGQPLRMVILLHCLRDAFDARSSDMKAKCVMRVLDDVMGIIQWELPLPRYPGRQDG